MSVLDKSFVKITEEILTNGIKQEDRTGTGQIILPYSVNIIHDMATGFPQLTIRQVPFRSAAVELEGFLKGVTSKKWYKDRGCHYWDQWCAPYKVPYGTDEETKKKMAEEDDLGPIYGAQLRYFIDPLTKSYTAHGIDQLTMIIYQLKTNPTSRRMLALYHNPLAVQYQALPACHFAWQVSVTGGKLNLAYYMRSVDWLLGNNLNSYGLLLHLLAKECGLKEGYLSGQFFNAHIYLNQIPAANELILREQNCSLELPNIKTEGFTDIFNWTYVMSSLVDYKHMGKIDIPLAI